MSAPTAAQVAAFKKLDDERKRMNCLTCNAPTDAEGRCTDDCQQTNWTEFLTDHELLERILPLLPDATLGEDRDGQWIIYTNCGPKRATDCPYCAYNGDTVTTHNPVAHAENGDPNTREEEA